MCKIMNEYYINKRNEKPKKLLKQIINFGLVGGIITALSLIIYWVCVYFGVHYQLANAIAFCITVAISYILNNIITFKSENKTEWSMLALLKTYATYSITGIFWQHFYCGYGQVF